MSIMPVSIRSNMCKLISVSVLLLFSGFAFCQESVANVVKRSSGAVVLIVTSDSSGQESALGSGFLVSADGEIVTNFHVIEGAHSAVVKLPSGAFVPVRGVLACDPERDLAILKVAGKNLPFLTLADNHKLRAGDHVVAIGSPLGLEGTVTDGIVSSIRESDGKKWIQTTAPASPGNSGGPLLNMNASVVGVITQQVSLNQGQNLNFAIPADEVRSLLSTAADIVPLSSISKGAVPLESRPQDTQGGIWTDPSTGLMWPRQDNRMNVKQAEAKRYCSSLDLGGRSDWRLPSHGELKSLFDLAVSQTISIRGRPNVVHIKGGIILSDVFPWIDGNTAFAGSPAGVYFDFSEGTRGAVEPEGRSNVLCVRGPSTP